MKLNWDNKIFFEFVKRKHVIGWDIDGTYNAFGKVWPITGMCIWIKGKNYGLVSSSMELKKYYSGGDNHFVNFPLYFGRAYKFKIAGFTYAKLVSCSRLVKARQKW